MPLLKGAKNIGRNVREMEKNHPRNVAVAAALRTAYGPQKRANGGHVGPLPGPTPGRADKVETTVEDGSHIISADAVAALGDGNSEAGYAKLMKMFPHSVPGRAAGGGIEPPGVPHMTSVPGTPHVSPAPHIIGMPHPHMTGAPHLAGVPKVGGIGSLPHIAKPHMAEGGKSSQVKVKLSHGEFGVSPQDVRDVAGKGDLERGHRALDAFQMTVRREWIKNLKKLPGPAKN
jgi:hypothetical protein